MCVLDFVFWSLKDPVLKSQVTKHLINTPEIWIPFISVSEKIFYFWIIYF